MHWNYEIVPVGGHHRLARRKFRCTASQTAKAHVQTVSEPAVTADAELDVRLLDGSGSEVWPPTCQTPTNNTP